MSGLGLLTLEALGQPALPREYWCRQESSSGGRDPLLRGEAAFGGQGPEERELSAWGVHMRREHLPGATCFMDIFLLSLTAFSCPCVVEKIKPDNICHILGTTPDM